MHPVDRQRYETNPWDDETILCLFVMRENAKSQEHCRQNIDILFTDVFQPITEQQTN